VSQIDQHFTSNRAAEGRRAGFWILVVIAALISYGSLYPLHFTVPDLHAEAWRKLFGDWSMWTSRGDVLGNVALFVPFGCAGVLTLAMQASLSIRIVAILLISFFLALVLQVAQIYVPERTASLADIFWNLVGSGVGIVAGVLMGNQPYAQWRRARTENVVPQTLIALWLFAELLPFVPSLDLQSIKNSVHAFLHPTIAPEQLVFHAAGALIAAWALTAIVREAHLRWWVLVVAAVVIVGKIIIVSCTLDVSTLLGLALGFGGWWLMRRWQEPKRSTALLITLLVAYAFGALMPFELRESPEPFNLIPFAGLLRGSMLLNSKALAANLYLYAGILGLIRMNGNSAVPSSIALAILVAIFETLQTYLIGRTPDITEPLLVLLVGQVLRFAPLAGAQRPKPVPPAQPIAPTERHSTHRGNLSSVDFNLLGWSLRLVLVCVSMALAFASVLRLPNVPYNVAELFLGNGAFPFLVIFALALLWTGAGAHLVGHYIAQSARPYLALPLLAFGAGVASLLLLCASVTQESIGDISGSNNLHWFVVNKDIWGAWARNLFLHIPVSVVEFVERPVRFATLYGPLVTFLALMFGVIEMREQGRLDARRVLPLALSAMLWLWLCKGIAFDWSSTDNLNELIARDGPWGWGGGGYLYALLAMICVNAVILTRMPLTFAWGAAAVSITLAMVPAGWWLLTQGLEQHVEKYGQVFSGQQFLLGPDRKHLLSQEVLFLRWSVLQLAGILVIAIGARIAQPLIRARTRRTARPTKSS
jgi:hypothetical protein